MHHPSTEASNRIAHKEPLVSSLLFWLSPRGPTRDLILNVRCCCCCAYPAATELEHPSGHALVVHVASRYAARDVRPTRQPWTGRGRVRRGTSLLGRMAGAVSTGALRRRAPSTHDEPFTLISGVNPPLSSLARGSKSALHPRHDSALCCFFCFFAHRRSNVGASALRPFVRATHPKSNTMLYCILRP